MKSNININKKDASLPEGMKDTKEWLDLARKEARTNRTEINEAAENVLKELYQDPEYNAMLEFGDLTLDDEEIERRALVVRYRDQTSDIDRDTLHEDLSRALNYKQGNVPDEFLLDKKEEIDVEEQADLEELEPEDILDIYNKGQDKNEDQVPLYSRILGEQAKEFSEAIDRSKRDFETLIGKNLTIVAGVTIFLIGIVIGINYGIEMGWIENRGKIGVGVISAGILYFLAHRLRDRLPELSSVFVAGATAIMYYTSHLYLDFYDVGNQIIAYLINLVIASIAMGFAVTYDRKRLAVFAILGAYISPFLIQSDLSVHNQAISYFIVSAYLMLLNIVMLVVGFYKSWKVVNYISFYAVLIIYGVLVLSADLNSSAVYNTLLMFSTIYYATFFIAVVVYSIKAQSHISGFNYLSLLLNTVYYVAIVNYVLYKLDPVDYSFYVSMYFIALCVFNWLYSYVLYRKDIADIQLFHSSIAYALFFGALSTYLMVDGIFLIILWAIEAAALMLIAKVTQIRLVANTSVILSGFMIITVFAVWLETYTGIQTVSFIANAPVVSSLLAIASLWGTYYILGTFDEEYEILGFQVEFLSDMYMTSVLVFLFLIGNIELTFHSAHQFGGNELRLLMIGIYNMAFSMIVWMVAGLYDMEKLRVNSGIFIVFFTLLYFVLGYYPSLNLRNKLLLEDTQFTSLLSNDTDHMFAFMSHYFYVGLCILGLYMLIRKIRTEYGKEHVLFSAIIFYTTAYIAILGAIELDHFFVFNGFDSAVNIFEKIETERKVGFAAFWAFCAVVYILSGMRWKILELRLSGLFILLVYLVKFLSYDIWRISTLAQILSLLVIGPILILVSVFYGKLKHTVLRNEIREIQERALKARTTPTDSGNAYLDTSSDDEEIEED